MFTINQQTSYALLLIEYLQEQPGYTPLSQVVGQTDMPQRYLARIAALLASAGYLSSKEGRNGGYKLAATLDDINLLEFLALFEEDLQTVKCQDPDYRCQWADICQHKPFFSTKLTGILTEELNNWTLADIMGEPKSTSNKQNKFRKRKNYAKDKKSNRKSW